MSKQTRSDQISPLRRQMIEDMTVRNLSPTTQQSYIHAVKKFSLYFDQSPDRLGLERARLSGSSRLATGCLVITQSNRLGAALLLPGDPFP